MDAQQVGELIAQGETLEVEFKRGLAGKFNDSDLVEAVVCLANGNGGVLLIGVEDSGVVSGAAPRHGAVTEPSRVDALIAARTVPPLQTRTGVVEVDGHAVVVVEVPAAPRIVGTANGLYVRRALRIDGTPQCVPYPAHEMLAREIDRGAIDFAAMPAPDASMADLDPLELERFRRMARASNSDPVLAELSDEEICRALGVLRWDPGAVCAPTLGAILLFGTDSAIRRYVPNHEVAFQFFDDLMLETNLFVRGPLFRVAEEMFAQVDLRNREEEVESGVLRIAIPLIPHIVIRESIANALVHRDYTALGPVRIVIGDESFTVTSPGAFPFGVRLDNLLRESKPRSPILADAFRRAGVVERSGRGISRMYSALLRLGREAPDYSLSDDRSVSAVVPLGNADIAFARFIAERENAAGRALRLFDLQVLHELRASTKSTSAELADALHRTTGVIRSGLGRMIEEGLVEARGSGRGTTYHLSAAVYRALDKPPAYIRVRGTDPIQQEQMVLQYVKSFGTVTRAQVAELCVMTPQQATSLLRRLVGRGALELRGQRRGAHYVLPGSENDQSPTVTA